MSLRLLDHIFYKTNKLLSSHIQGVDGGNSATANPSMTSTPLSSSTGWAANEPQPQTNMFPFVENFSSFHDYYPPSNSFALEAPPPGADMMQQGSIGANNQDPGYGAFEIGPGETHENMPYDRDVPDDHSWMGPWQ